MAVLDDFAHHPTAVKVTLEALRLRFGGRRLWAVFEPRSNSSCRNIFQEAYSQAFDSADKVLIARPHNQSRIEESERLDGEALAASIRARGVEADYLEQVEDIIATVAANAMEGDVVAVLSNGGFEGIHGKLVKALEARFNPQ